MASKTEDKRAQSRETLAVLSDTPSTDRAIGVALLTPGAKAGSDSDSLTSAVATIARHMRSADAMTREAVAPFLAMLASAPEEVGRITRTIKVLLGAEREDPKDAAGTRRDKQAIRQGVSRGMTTPLQLVPEHSNRELVAVLTGLLELAEVGAMKGLVYGAEFRGQKFFCDAAGSMHRNPMVALGVTQMLSAEILQQIS